MTSRTMFTKSLRHAGHVRRFVVRDTGREGWEVRREQDNRVIQETRYTDWHRVERALTILSLEVSDLEREGWIDS